MSKALNLCVIDTGDGGSAQEVGMERGGATIVRHVYPDRKNGKRLYTYVYSTHEDGDEIVSFKSTHRHYGTSMSCEPSVQNDLCIGT